MFDDGEDISHLIDCTSGHHPGWVGKRIPMDLPGELMDALDREARKRGMKRRALIELWLEDALRRAP
jgi:hypothetical protein